MINLLKASKNPSAMMQSLAATNPQMRSVMEMVNRHGGDARAAFYDLAKQKGVDPNEVLSYLQKM